MNITGKSVLSLIRTITRRIEKKSISPKKWRKMKEGIPRKRKSIISKSLWHHHKKHEGCMIIKYEGYSSWESHWKHKWQGHLLQGSSYICQKETFADGDTLDPQDYLMGSSLKGSPIMRGSKCFIKNSKLVEFMDDGMMT